MMEKWEREFQEPGREYRSQPFWAWDGELSEEEIRWQIREMARQGVGGFFMHSREGLETPYMGEKWLSCIRAAVEEAGKYGMHAWLYDEDRWPSGTAGGQVTALGDVYRLKGLTLEVCQGQRAWETWRQITASAWEPAEDSGEDPACIPGGRSMVSKGERDRQSSGEDALDLPVAGGELPEGGLLLAVYAASVEGMEIHSFRRLSLGEGRQPRSLALEGEERLPSYPLKDGEVLLVARLQCSAGSEWFNGQAPPDNLNPDTVACFLEKTHEVYYQAVGDVFGKVVCGCFTDEPSLADRHAAFPPGHSWIPWTYGFIRYYKKKRGSHVLDTLPYIYFNGEGSTRARYAYWRTVSDRYLETYSKAISRWCQEHGIAYTGHFLQEDKLGLCARVNGSIMPHYKYQGIPGIDMLREETREYITVKQCTSVAHQFGKRNVLTETYGCTGWDFTFEGMKWIGDWQYVLGVNTRCPHLALYSLKGLRKRDYPPSFHYNTSWWEKNHVMEEYFARLGVALGQGRPVRKLLVLHPMGTAWARLGVSPYGNPVRRLERDVPGINQYGNGYNRLLEELSRQHMDYDLGDETLIESDGSVEGPLLRIGEAVYEAVLVPAGDTWQRSTVDLLQRFADQGGKIFWMEPLAQLVDGDRDAATGLARLVAHCRSQVCGSIEGMVGLLGANGLRTLDITDDVGIQVREILALRKRDGEKEILFLVNQDRGHSHAFHVHVPRQDTYSLCRDVEEWDPLDGSRWKVEWKETSDGVSFARELGACESGLYRIQWKENRQAVQTQDRKPGQETGPEPENRPRQRHMPRKRLAVCPDTVPVCLTQPNVYVLDRCSYMLAAAGDGEAAGMVCILPGNRQDLPETDGYRVDLLKAGIWQEEREIWQVQKQIRELLGMRENDGGEQIQRYMWVHGEEAVRGYRIRLKMAVTVEVLPQGPVWLAAEDAGELDLYVNGIRQEKTVQGWYLDKSFGRRPVRGLELGRNEILIERLYQEKSELEACYLLGDFGVFRDAGKGRVIRGPVRELSCGDWTLQGLLHYAGSVVYQYEMPGQRQQRTADADTGYMLRLGRCKAVCATVRFNGKETEVPWKARGDVWIPACVMQEKNRCEIEVFSSPRNMLGPFHLAGGRPWTTNAGCFKASGEKYTRNYQTVPYGLMETPELWEAE